MLGLEPVSDDAYPLARIAELQDENDDLSNRYRKCRAELDDVLLENDGLRRRVIDMRGHPASSGN
jgi:hypothetical protein